LAVYSFRGDIDNDIVFVISLAAVVGAAAFVILYLYKVLTFTKPFFEIDKILINDKIQIKNVKLSSND
jgi:hypothetical protein